jgi:hypothetical protein
MKLSKVIETLTTRRTWLLRMLDEAEHSTPKWHRINQEQRAIECALPVLELELVHRQARTMEQELA